MTVHSKTVSDGKECVISIHDKFIFRLYRNFRQAYTHCDPATELITVDLKNTNYIDSSALGMLLLLKKYAQEHDLNVRIVNITRHILRAFEVVHLDKEFDISVCPDEDNRDK